MEGMENIYLDREIRIKEYFNAWINSNPSCLSTLFSSTVTYTECYGPVYYGLEQINRWFLDWHLNGEVIVWDIKQFIHQGDTMVVEWYFECIYENSRDGFDGISLIKFDDSGKVLSLKEFQSKAEHYLPYAEHYLPYAD